DQAQLQKPWRKRWWMMGFGIFFYLLICGVTVLSFIPLIDSWKYFSLRRSDPFLILIPAALVLLVLYMTWYLIKTPKGWRDFRAAMTSHKKTIVSGVLSDLTVGDTPGVVYHFGEESIPVGLMTGNDVLVDVNKGAGPKHVQGLTG